SGSIRDRKIVPLRRMMQSFELHNIDNHLILNDFYLDDSIKRLYPSRPLILRNLQNREIRKQDESL
ncbi:MAG: hypothetical protein ACE5E2_05310, partial [Candidatus Binatia bacterium]